MKKSFPPPPTHPSGVQPPKLPKNLIPKHVALVMDGNGRWAQERGLPRTAGHEAGEASLLDCVHGALELGIGAISAYAFSTENWRRSPEEVRFLKNNPGNTNLHIIHWSESRNQEISARASDLFKTR